MSAKPMKIELSRSAFSDLYTFFEKCKEKKSQGNLWPFYYPESAVDDFLTRNAEKYEKKAKLRDEAIAFPRFTVVGVAHRGALRYDSMGRTNCTAYVVIRIRKLPTGKREYWLSELNPLLSGRGSRVYRLIPDKKVSAQTIVKLRDCTPDEINHITNSYRLPREM